MSILLSVLLLASIGVQGRPRRSMPTPTPKPAHTAQAAPSNLTAFAVSSSQINLAWTGSSGNNTGFYIERAPSAAGPWKRVASLPANATSSGNGGLDASTTYYYRVMAHNSAYSNVVSATTLSRLPAGAPSHLAAKAGSSTQINLSWTNNAGDATGFKIERCEGSGCSNFTEIESVAADATSYQNTALSPLTSYSYRVRAYNSRENSGFSDTATATTWRDTTPPAVPAQLTATPVSSVQINLRWNPPASSGGVGVAGYAVYQAGVQIINTTKTSYSVKGLAANVLYCYTVSAYDKQGNRSDQSVPACATTKSDPTPESNPGEKPN